MTQGLLLKGFEVELFTGKVTGENVGVAAEASKELSEFVKEPDHRNLEYITAPESQFDCLKEALLAPRRRLRNWLTSRKLTILPGSTLSLGDSKKFERSDPTNPYHDLIETTYGTRVVTASIHINLGIDDTARLFSALRLVRCEASLLLALSASSPFLDGVLTGVHSQRWLQFPLTPEKVSLFVSHDDYVQWVEDKLRNGLMWNERHLWTSVRPNGPSRPHELNRLELRICDLITDCDLLLAITALLELRVITLFSEPSLLDPLDASLLSIEELAALSDVNDLAAAKTSLDATLHHWRDGKPILCREWIEQLLDEVMPLAGDMNMVQLLTPIHEVLDKGNQAMQWTNAYLSGESIEAIIQKSIHDMEEEENFFLKTEAILG